MTFAWNWENKFKPWELVQYIDAKKLVEVDLTTVVGSERPVPSDEFARWMVAFVQLHHRQTVLLPHAACWPVLRALRPYCHMDYWLIEQDAAEYLKIAEDETIEAGPHTDDFIYSTDTLWFRDFDDWCEQYDAENKADAILLIGPPYRASSDMFKAWPYLKPRGNMVAVIPKSDLFDKGENGKIIRDWCTKHELTYGVPKKGLLECPSGDELVVIFGEKLNVD